MRPRRIDWITNGALVAIAIALVVALVVTRGRVTSGESESRSFNVLAAWRTEEVKRISVTRGKETFRLDRTAKSEDDFAWRLSAPYEEDAEPFAMEKVLGTLEYASVIRRIRPEEENRAAFGLDDPRLVMEVSMGDIVYRLRLGKDAVAPPGSAYLEVTGEGSTRKGIVIVGKSLVEELDVRADDFRARYVVPYLSPALVRFRLEGAGGARAFRRAEWDGWRFDGMEGDLRAERQALDRVLLQFARTVADDLMDTGEAEKALASGESVVITQTPKDPKLKPGKVKIGGQCPTDPERIVALRIEPDKMAGCVTRTVWAGLTSPASAIVDRTLFYLRRDEVESVEIQRGERKLRLERKDDAFVMREPRQGDVDAEAGNGRLDAILRATGRTADSNDVARLGFSPPAGRVTIRSAASSDAKVKEETVLLGNVTANGSVLARREHDGQLLELVREVARALTPDAALIRSRTLFDQRVDAVTRVEIEGLVDQAFTRDDKGGIRLERPSGFVSDAGVATEIIDALRTLTVDRWVADEDDGTFGFDRPVGRARFTTRLDGKETAHEIVIGRPTASGHFARLTSDGGVFVLPRRVVETLGTFAIDRAVFVVDPGQVATVEIQAADRRVALTRLGTEFVQEEGEQLSPASLQRIVDALSTMRAEAAIQTGLPRAEHGLADPILRVKVRREAGLSGPKEVAWEVGAGDTWRGLSVHYARAQGADAVFVVSRSQVQQVLDAL